MRKSEMTTPDAIQVGTRWRATKSGVSVTVKSIDLAGELHLATDDGVNRWTIWPSNLLRYWAPCDGEA
jgi:hypothetical protein